MILGPHILSKVPPPFLATALVVVVMRISLAGNGINTSGEVLGSNMRASSTTFWLSFLISSCVQYREEINSKVKSVMSIYHPFILYAYIRANRMGRWIWEEMKWKRIKRSIRSFAPQGDPIDWEGNDLNDIAWGSWCLHEPCRCFCSYLNEHWPSK